MTDKKLCLEIIELRQNVENLRNKLYGPLAGDSCSCRGDNICAHHADINNFLVDADDTLNLAIESLDNGI